MDLATFKSLPMIFADEKEAEKLAKRGYVLV